MTDEPATYGLTFEIGKVTPTLNQWQRMHPQARTRLHKSLALLVMAATAGKKPARPLERARVTVERHSRGMPDHDNLVGGCKPLIDVLCAPTFRGFVGGKPRVQHKFGLSFLADDKSDVLQAIYRSVRVGKSNQQKTVVTVEGWE